MFSRTKLNPAQLTKRCSGAGVAELTSSPAASSSVAHHRAVHFSSRRSATHVSENIAGSPGSYAERAQIPASSWSRPPRASQDADDNVVPTYYVERKKQRDAVAERKEEEEEGGLMAELSAGILSEGVAAQTRVREEKIPVEVRHPDGSISHPSGFQPPTPETLFHPIAAKTPTINEPGSLFTTVKELWHAQPVNARGRSRPDPSVEKHFQKRKVNVDVDAASVFVNHQRTEQGPSGTFDSLSHATRPTPSSRGSIPTSSWDSPRRSTRQSQIPDDVVPPYYIERKRQRDAVAERKEEEGSLMAELNAGILSDGLAVEMRMRDEKIPVEVAERDGTVRHPSGFEPPTAETDFHPMASKPTEAPMKMPWTEVLTLKNARGA